MKTNNLILVGGGFIAGYVLCKLMNRNSESMSFSLSGEDDTISGGRGYEGQKFRFNGKGAPLRAIGSMTNSPYETRPSQRYLNEIFKLSGKSKKFIRMENPPYTGKYAISDSPNAILYRETLIVENRAGMGVRRIWLPADSIEKI